MSFKRKDIEWIEWAVYKGGDAIAASISRNFERLGERIDAAERRIDSRLAEPEDKMDSGRQNLADELSEIRGEVREFARPREDELQPAF